MVVEAADIEAELSLVRDFWARVHDDLKLGLSSCAGDYIGLETYHWLHSPDYARWVALTIASLDPAAVRSRLMADYWPAADAIPPMPDADEEWPVYRRRALWQTSPLYGSHRRLAS